MKNRVREAGQGLTEFGLVVTLFILVTLGIVEFGYDFLAFHLVTQATSAGARAASVLQHNCGAYNSPTDVPAITSLVSGQVGSVANISSVRVATLNEGTCPVPNGTIPQVTVTVQASVPRMFNGVVGPATLDLNRTETFRDEAMR